MEIIKRKILKENTANNTYISATTINLPIFLTQTYEDIGIYTDVKESFVDIITGFTATWDLSYDGSLQKDCKTTNKCLVTNTVNQATYYNASDGSIITNVTNYNTLECPGNLNIQWTGPDGFTANNVLTINNLKAGNYTLKITDANCDRTFKTYYVPQPGPLDSDINVNNSQVNDTTGICNGSATVITTGGRPPYTYAWYSAGTTTPVLGTNNTLINLCIGNYYVVITDSDNSVVTEFFTISQPPPLSGTVKTVINIDCQGNSGEIKVKGVGGYLTNGYSYTLNGVTNNTGIFDTNITSPGIYNVIIADNGGSTFILPVTITQPIQPIVVTKTTTQTNTDGIDDLFGVTGNLTYNITGGEGIGTNGDYNVSLNPVFYTVSTNNNPPLNSTVGSGGYQLNNNGSFISLQSGWYQLNVSDNVCEHTENIYIPNTFDPYVDVSNYGNGILQAVIDNVSIYEWYIIKWSDGSQYACPTVLGGTPCSTGYALQSNTNSSGTELTLEVLWVNNLNPTDVSLWKTFKRIYRVP